MAAKKKGSASYGTPYNETGSGGPESPDMTGKNMYWDGWDEINRMHLTEGDMEGTPNTHSGDTILGGPAPGEPNAAKK